MKTIIFKLRKIKTIKQSLKNFKLTCYLFLFFNFFYKSISYFYNYLIHKHLYNKVIKYFNNTFLIKLIITYNLNNICAKFITNLMCLRLKQNVSLNIILKNITKILYNADSIYSYRIISTGKFSRKQRSTYIISNSKDNVEIPNGSTSEYIDYNSSSISTRYGICNIKVWLVSKYDFSVENNVLQNDFVTNNSINNSKSLTNMLNNYCI
jgi:hypothetical protein